MNIDDELNTILIQHLPGPGNKELAIKEIKALFKPGVCADCGAYNHCEIPHYMGYLMSSFDENKDYCSKFWLDNESEQLPNKGDI